MSDWEDDVPTPNNKMTKSSAAVDGWDEDNAATTNNSSSNYRNENNDRGFRPKKKDWICSSCSTRCFGNRTECYKCQTERTDDCIEAPDDGNSNDRRGRAPDWICDSCGKRVFGSKSECYSCHSPKGDSKDAPDDGNNNSRGGRSPDWICDSCGKRVFGSKTECYSCHSPKGDSKDAPDDGNNNNRGGRSPDWICDSCGKRVFGSKTECFSCHSPKGDSKDAPDTDDNNNRNGGKFTSSTDDNNNDDEKKKEENWLCECGENNFPSRFKCRKCETPKPRKEGDPEPKEYYCPVTLDEKELFSTGISMGINFERYNKIPVEVTDESRNKAPKAIQSFGDSGLNNLLLENLVKSGYKNPTPIQKSSIPIIMAKRDLMACAQTGSGKTAAFLLPIINTLMNEQADLTSGLPYALVVTPTRELTTQIYNEARKFAQGGIVRCAQIYGGTSTRFQRDNVNGHILVATPGRLLDFLEKGIISFPKLRYVVLDEADRMLDMGFKDDIKKIMDNAQSQSTSTERQTLMFSATFPLEIRKLAKAYLKDSVFVQIGTVGACTDVTQNVIEADKIFSKKRDKLMEILDQGDCQGTIVFVETKAAADRLAAFLCESSHPTTSIHGDRKQSQREEALRDFKSGKMKVLIATAVAARGLDIPNVRHVINFDLPKSIDEYIHRIGRTGRIGNAGNATSFFCSETDAEIESDLVKVLKDAGQTVPDFLQGGGGGDFGGNGDIRSSAPANKDASDDGWD